MSATHAPQARIGDLWQQRMDTLREYEVVRDGNVFATSFSNNILFSSEYDGARQYLRDLLKRYDGCSFDTVFCGGREHANEGGTCYLLESRESIDTQHSIRTGINLRFLGISRLSMGLGKPQRSGSKYGATRPSMT